MTEQARNRIQYFEVTGWEVKVGCDCGTIVPPDENISLYFEQCIQKILEGGFRKDGV